MSQMDDFNNALSSLRSQLDGIKDALKSQKPQEPDLSGAISAINDLTTEAADLRASMTQPVDLPHEPATIVPPPVSFTPTDGSAPTSQPAA